MTARFLFGLAVLAARPTAIAAIPATASSPVSAAPSCSPWVLPLGTYEGTLDSNNVCVYSNVRFASPPIGDLRFAAPEYPPKGSQHPNDTIPHPICVQMTVTPCLSSPGIPLVGDGPGCLPPKFGNETEDCLFLDAYVPLEAFSTNKTLPVVVWIYGGAYLFGSKNQYNSNTVPFYLGDGFVNTATDTNQDDQTSIIFVTGNYRLRAFGWLAGSYMEQNAQPNAGLLDQQAVMRFVQDNIGGVNGNPENVSIWGESAGASSILHHLTMPQNGSQTALFNKAIVQSPAYQWLWDREGSLNNTFTEFATKVSALAKCSQADIACLRSANVTTEMLSSINQNLFGDAACQGIMPVGPSVDGGQTATVNGVIPYLAPYALSQGKAAHLDTIVISHVDNEVPYSSNTSAFSFIPLPIRESPKNETAFQAFLAEVFQGGEYAGIRSEISKQYPISSFKDQIDRAAHIIRDSSFTCNTRFMADHYIPNVSKKVYAMDYAVFGHLLGDHATHGSDLVPAFVNKQTDYTTLLTCVLGGGEVAKKEAEYVNGVLTKKVPPGMQEMFTKHAIWGDPNYKCQDCGYKWQPAEVGACPGKSSSSCIQNLLKPKAPTLLEGVWHDNAGADLLTQSGTCDFWMEVATNVTKLVNKDTDQLLEQQSDLWMEMKQAALNEEL